MGKAQLGIPAPNSQRTYKLPRLSSGEPEPWVIDFAAHRARGYSVPFAAARAGISAPRAYNIMRDPEYHDLEIAESLKLLVNRRGRVLLAVADRAEEGDIQAARLLLELTGVLQPVKPILVNLNAIIGVSIQEKPLGGPGLEDPHLLAEERDRIFAQAFGMKPIDAIFRKIPPEPAP